MAKGDITLSPKHGLNPSLGLCFFCGKENGTVVIPGKLKGDIEAPRHAVWDMTPCEECKKLMDMGILFIEVKDGEKGARNPYRTGRQWVLKQEAVERLIADEAMRDNIIKHRFAFIEEHDAREIGFPAVEGE